MFTSQRPCDVEVILNALYHSSAKTGRVKFLEVGTFGGDTANGILDWCNKNSVALDYCGIDSRAQIHSDNPIPGSNFIVGDSAEVFHLVPNGLDVVLVDACHCINHVILDTLHYGARVRPGGFLLFHDTSREVQQTMKDPHGPDIPEFHNSVNAAHKLMGFPTQEWKLWHDVYEPGAPWGGMRMYQKAPHD
jgi:hypothetical protein